VDLKEKNCFYKYALKSAAFKYEGIVPLDNIITGLGETGLLSHEV
jgi:hypothetical protein